MEPSPAARPERTRVALGTVVVLFLGFLATAGVATQPLGFGSSTYLPANADAVLNAWTLNQVCQGLVSPSEILRGNMFYPDSASLLYSETLLGIGLQSLPFCVLGLNHVALYNASYAIVLAMCALGAWLLALEITRSASAALVSAAVFAFTSANYDSAARLQIVASMWTPIFLLFLIRFCRGGRMRDAALMGLAFALQALSCGYYEILLATLMILTLPSWIGLTGGWAKARQRVPGMLLAILVSGVLTLPLNLAQREHLSPVLVPRSPAPQLTTSSFTEVLSSNFLYGEWLGRSGVAYDDMYFPGLLPVGLAALFFATGARRRDWCRRYAGLRPVLILGAVAFILAFGERVETPWMEVPGPLSIFSNLMPGLAQVRVPARFLMFARLALAVVAACGLLSVRRHATGARATLVGLAIAAACIAEHWSSPLGVWRVPTKSELPAVYEWLGQPERSPGPLLEFPPSPLRLRREEAAWLHTAAFHGLPMVNGYSSFRPAWFEFVMESALDERNERFVAVLRRMGVRTVVVHPRPSGLPDVDRATEALLGYADRHPDQLGHVKSFSDGRGWEGIWSRLGDEIVLSIKPLRVAGLANVGPEVGRQGWTCRSSEPDCDLALDGDAATLIRGRGLQGAGDFLKIRFPTPRKIDAVSISLGRFPELFPRNPMIRLLRGDEWVPVDADLNIEAFLSGTMTGSENPVMAWTFPPRLVGGFEIRLRSGGPRFRELGIPEVNAHAR